MAGSGTARLRENLTDQEKVVCLFQFVEELNKLKQKKVLNISDYNWYRTLSGFPNDPENIVLYYQDRVEEDGLESQSGNILLSVHKPEFSRCPQPDEDLLDWLEDGWDSFRNKVQVKESRRIEKPEHKRTLAVISHQKTDPTGMEPPDVFESFSDNAERVQAFEKWNTVRNAWAEKQKIVYRTREFFSELYNLYFDLQRDSETMEIVVANGMLLDSQNKEIRHPVLTKRVRLRYDPVANTVYLEDLDVQGELYTIMLQEMDGLNLGAINQLQADLQTNDYHPLDRNETPDFLKVLVHQLSSDSQYSKAGIPENWERNSRLLLYLEPCFIMRKRLGGTLRAIEQIIQNVQETGYVPSPVLDLVSGGQIVIPEDTGEENIEERLAAVGGESMDVLLSKEANSEQLDIAKRIARYNAVLVQGPPGTGKTHTIANLLGHFLAQGKSVLVTSHTPKALTVLKEKIVPGLRDLCVSVLEDSNIDMERSVDGITEYMSRTTSCEIKREMEALAQQRQNVIRDLASVRRKLFEIIHQECNCIAYNGEGISPSKAAMFVVERAEELSDMIPGKVRLQTPLPIAFPELVDLYRSNETLTAQEEAELNANLPSPDSLLTPESFAGHWRALRLARKQLQQQNTKAMWVVENQREAGQISFHNQSRLFSIAYPAPADVQQLTACAKSLEKIEDWMVQTAADGECSGSHRQRWVMLAEQIEKTVACAENVVAEQFGQRICFKKPGDLSALSAPLEKLKGLFSEKGKVTKLTLMFHKDCAIALDSISINDKPIQSEKDCAMILHMIELDNCRKVCAAYWDALLSPHGIPHFFELDCSSPERVAKNWVPLIKRYLDWHQEEYARLLENVKAVGIPAELLFEADQRDSDFEKIRKILSAAAHDLPIICNACDLVSAMEQHTAELEKTKAIVRQGAQAGSQTAWQLLQAMDAGNTESYQTAFNELSRTYEKYTLQRERSKTLAALEAYAPQWADAIRNREGIHGAAAVPDNIEEAWKWKQLSGLVDEITAQPFDELQRESVFLSKEYRKVTAAYAEKSAWYHLLQKTEGNIDMCQALQGWKQTVKKIGKGTGKNAPKQKAEARKLMSKCQVAVPSWIMPMNRALESLNPKENRFDIIIIDEASQSDISSLAILYMGKKLIIVGDDQQVSPTAVGVDLDKLDALQQMYIRGRIPNAHLYDATTSIYDIAKTTFQPLMLREHFRCVPEIIGFSNMLSYNYNIKPLRDTSDSVLLPAVVNYRVADGARLPNKTNPNEAKMIAALVKACIEQPEYADKSFGVVSLLGDEQVKEMQRQIDANIDRKEIVSRRILCGNASNFQGDERDVVFLSMVDSGNSDGPLSKREYGPGDMYRKRYNVAASRARDQLWVVDSLDAANDLKQGDIRKTLIEYSLDPAAHTNKRTEIQANAESPFEAAVAQALTDRGYHLVQQWKVGAYRLDMVAIYGKSTVAIECDGERYHSGEAKIREDMERQTILERLGWRFIRIRGSEYYRNPDKTMERVMCELHNLGIEPETGLEDRNAVWKARGSMELLDRVKTRAAQILQEWSQKAEDEIDLETIAAALDPKSMTSGVAAFKLQKTTPRTEPIPKAKVAAEKKRHPTAKSARDKGTVQAKFEGTD